MLRRSEGMHNENHPGTNEFALSTSYLATSEPTEGSKRYQMLAEAKSTALALGRCHVHRYGIGPLYCFLADTFPLSSAGRPRFK